MDIERLKQRRQLNVQEQNALQKAQMLDTAVSFRADEPHWLRAVLEQVGLDAAHGVLVTEGVVPCGAGEESARACWVTDEQRFYDIDATLVLGTSSLLEVESCRDVTATTPVTRHQPGTGKSFGYLALEVRNELLGR